MVSSKRTPFVEDARGWCGKREKYERERPLGWIKEVPVYVLTNLAFERRLMNWWLRCTNSHEVRMKGPVQNESNIIEEQKEREIKRPR